MCLWNSRGGLLKFMGTEPFISESGFQYVLGQPGTCVGQAGLPLTGLFLPLPHDY